MNHGLFIDIWIVCVTNILGTILIYTQIVGATGFQKYLLTKVFPLYEICSLFRCKRNVGAIVFHKHIF